MIKRSLQLPAIACALCFMTFGDLPSKEVFAAGIEIPDNGTKALGRGGAYVAGAEDLTAIYYNPARLGVLKGTRGLYNHNLLFSQINFTRATLSPGWAESDPNFEAVSDSEGFFYIGGFGAISSDFGLDDWTFALGVYGPSSVGKRSYPTYGPQSFMVTEMDTIMPYYTASVAYTPREDFAMGASLQWADLISMKYSVVVDVSKVPSPGAKPDTSKQHTEVTLNLSDRTNITGIIGLWWAINDAFEVGLASRVIPMNIEAEGSVDVLEEGIVTEDVTATAEFTIPIQIRGGIRYIHREPSQDELFDIEFDVFYENWAAFKELRATLDGTINAENPNPVVLPRNWNDTITLRLGSDWNAMDWLTLRTGGYWENGATPENYEHLDFPSFDRYAFTGGASFHLGPVSLSVAYAHILQEDRTVTEDYGKVLLQRPLLNCPDECGGLTGVVANAGTFESGFQIVSVGMEATF